MEEIEPTITEGTDHYGALDPGDDVDMLRQLVLKAHPDVVPELVRGNTVAEMLASVPDAQAAYARIAEVQAQAKPANSPIPAGGTVRTQAINTEGLSAMAKIRSGLGGVRG